MIIGNYVQTSHGKIGILTHLGKYKVKLNEEITFESQSKKEAIDFIEKNNGELIEEECRVFFNKKEYPIYLNQLKELNEINLKIYSGNRHITLKLPQDDVFKRILMDFDDAGIVYYLVKD